MVLICTSGILADYQVRTAIYGASGEVGKSRVAPLIAFATGTLCGFTASDGCRRFSVTGNRAPR
jgi:hypothetical protein